MVDGSVSAADAVPLSVRAYARHRGVSAPAVLKAIEAGRLKACLVNVDGKAKIANVALADQEWTSKTDLSRAPGYVKVRAATAPPPVSAAPSSRPVPPAARQSDAVDPPQTATTVGSGLTLADASAREKEWKAKLAELEYHERSKNLIDAREVESRMVDVFTRTRTKLLGIPSKAKTVLPHLSHADLVALDRLVRDALEELANTVDEPAA